MTTTTKRPPGAARKTAAKAVSGEPASKAGSKATPTAEGKAASATRRSATPHPEPGTEVGGQLTAAQDEFARLVAQGQTRSAAFRRAFPRACAWKQSTVHARASELAAHGLIAARIDELQRAAARANEAGVADVLRQYLQRLHADPRDVVEVRVSPCRYCWGKGHLWQHTDGELARARARHAERAQKAQDNDKPAPPAFDEEGGGGFDARRPPNDKCPSCAGAGHPRVVLHDSRGYGEGALALFEGVKETKEGLEVKLASRDDALEKVARFVGFFEVDNAQQAGAPPVDTAALDAMYDVAMAQWQEQKAHALGRLDRLRAAGVKIDDDVDRPA